MSRQVLSGVFRGERALFGSCGVEIIDSIFLEGESPLKESQDLVIKNTTFQWKYPLWYCRDVEVSNCTWFDMGRAGVWYSKHLSIEDSLIEAPKNFRRCEELRFTNVSFTNALETLWHCKSVELDHVTARGDYFAMNCVDMEVSHLNLVGNYSFDGVQNLTIRNSRLISKDAFWNSLNVTVYDSYISGEYLGWNSKNLTLINCTIESLQGLCYIENLVMKNCKLINTNLAFEYSTLDVELIGHVDSIKNPISGTIVVDSVGELILDQACIDPDKTTIVIKNQTNSY